MVSKKQEVEKKIRVLYTEDNPIDIDLTLSHFSIEAPEFEFTIAGTGKEFFKLAKKSKFNIYLFDHHLPDTLGIDIIKTLAQEKNETPIVMVTGLGDEELIVQALRIGATDYLPKHGDYLPTLVEILRKVYSDNINKISAKKKLAAERIKVLYVEQHKMDIEQTVNFFSKDAPYIEILAVNSLTEAWDIINKSTDINLILSDLRLPGDTGLDFLHQLRLKKIEIPFIMITGGGDESTAIASLKLGAYDYVAKSKNYLERLPNIILNAYYKNKFEQANQNLSQEIVDKKTALKLLTEAEERFRSVFENTYIGLYRTTPDGKIILVNPALLKMLGYSSFEELAKRNLEESGFEPDYSRSIFKKEIEENGKVIGLESAWKRKDGSFIYVRESARVINDENGKPLYYEGTVEDITERKRASEAIAQSEKKYREVVENATDIIFTTDANGKFTYSNSAGLINSGYTLDELIKLRFIDLVLPEYRYRLSKFYSNQQITKTPTSFIEYPFHKKGGEIRWLAQNATLIIQNEKVTGYHLIARDITEQKKMKESLLLSEKKYRYLFDNNPQPMWVYDLETLVFLEVNDAAVLVYGYSKQEYLKMTLKDIRPEEDINALLEDVEHTTKEINQAGIWRHKKKSGEIIFVEITSHLINYENRKARLVLANDVTERKRAEESLRESEERYKSFIQLSSEAICMFELEKPIDINLPVDEQIDELYKFSVIKECNQIFCNNHGLRNPEEAVGMRLGMIFPKLSKENVEHLRNFIEKGYNVAGLETKELTKNADVRHFLNSWSGIVEDSKFLRMWNSKQDITRIKEVEEEIRKLNTELEQRVIERTNELEISNKELESFSYSVSHDLRAPLRAITGYSNILKEDYGNKVDDEGKEYLDDIISNANKMGILIDDLLRLSRVSKKELSKQKINMKLLFENVISEINLDEDKVNIIVNNMPETLGDNQLLKIAANNLLSNAIKFSGNTSSPVIEIGGKKENNSTQYYVKDNGVGFNMDYQEKLFEVFQRLHTTDEFEGTGIGLAIVKRIITKHNGTVWAEGKLNEGATFYFELPNE